MALKAGYYGLKRSLLNKVKELPGIKSIGAGLSLNSTTGELEATGATILIEANPEGAATENLIKLGLGETVYAIPDAAKTYLTDDATESAIVDADYIPFFDSSAASGSGAPKKSTWSNFISKIKAKITEFVTWEANNILGAKNLVTREEKTFIRTTDRTINNPIPSGIKNGQVYRFTADVSDVSGYSVHNTLISLRLGANPSISADISVPLDTEKINVTLVANNDVDGSSANSCIYIYQLSDENENATCKLSNMMLRLGSDSDDTYVPYAMTNKELTEKKADKDLTVLSNVDLNDIKENGKYLLDGNITNGIGNYGFLVVIAKTDKTSVKQIYVSGKGTIESNLYFRTYGENVWDSWYKVEGTIVS